MSDGLNVSEISLLNDIKRMDSVSHNLANVNTSGFKQQITQVQSFQDVMAISVGGDTGRQQSLFPAEVPQIVQHLDDRSAALKYTGRPLDVALVDEVMMAVASPQGEVYTRQGDLHIDAMGRLVTSTGYPIMGKGGEIRLTSDKPLINQQGQIYIDQQVVAELKLVKKGTDTELESLGNGLYAAGKTEQLADSEAVLRQGYVEAANVNMTEQMVKMIEIVRHFESTQKMIRSYDEMLDSAINQIADFEGL